MDIACAMYQYIILVIVLIIAYQAAMTSKWTVDMSAMGVPAPPVVPDAQATPVQSVQVPTLPDPRDNQFRVIYDTMYYPSSWYGSPYPAFPRRYYNDSYIAADPTYVRDRGVFNGNFYNGGHGFGRGWGGHPRGSNRGRRHH